MTDYQAEIYFVFREIVQSKVLVYLGILLVIILIFYFFTEFYLYPKHFNFQCRIKATTLQIISTLENFYLSAYPFIIFHPYCYFVTDLLISANFNLKLFFHSVMISMRLLNLSHVSCYY